MLLTLACGTRVASAQGEGMISREYPLKALFLFNFGSYIEWPADAFPNQNYPFVIGVLGHAPLEDHLADIAASKRIHGRQVVVRRFASIDQMEPCHILFVARDVPVPQQHQAVQRLRGSHTLLVGETQVFAQYGGSVNFFVDANKIRFEINLDAAKAHQLRISAKLLALARIVQSGPQAPAP